MAAYATREDLYRLGIRAEALEEISTDDQDAALEASSRYADSFLASRFQLPLIAPYPADLVANVCQHAAYTLLAGTRGFNPESSQSLRDRYDDAVDWFKGISRNLVHPQVTDSSPTTSSGRPPRVVSKPPRGWTS